MDRVVSSGKRWRAAYRENGVVGLKDTRKGNSGRPRDKELSIEERFARLEAVNNLLKAEKRIVKKDRLCRKEAEEVKLSAEQKFLLIHSVIEKYQLKNMVSYLCDAAGVSRSGYYNYYYLQSKEQREKRDTQDEVVKEVILKAYNFKGRKKGAKQIKMTLQSQYNITYNLKRIRRIMNK